jgi:6-pyruvoyltetrahydropterin/6-carboxytetrahydropterin synthase
MLVTRVERVAAATPAADGRIEVLAFGIEASVADRPDPVSGMVVNLAAMKEELRREVVARLDGRMLDGAAAPAPAGAEWLAREVWRLLGGRLAGRRLVRVRLAGSRGPSVEYRGGDEMDVTRTYEFSASHRLHAPSLSDEENRRVFGKCNNPSGHGHNYVLEVTLRGTGGRGGAPVFPAELDRVVHAEVVERWDHRHLNEDLPEFRGVNPTAEEIARVAWRRLAAPLAAAAGPLRRLVRIKLRETERNHVEYFGEDDAEDDA